MDLEKAGEEKKTLTIEFLMGSPDDRDALFFYNGVMEKLQGNISTTEHWYVLQES